MPEPAWDSALSDPADGLVLIECPKCWGSGMALYRRPDGSRADCDAGCGGTGQVWVDEELAAEMAEEEE